MSGDFNINILNKNDESTSYFSELQDTFNQKNLVTKPTYHKFLKGSIIDLILTVKLRSFQKTSFCETRLSDCHKPIFTILKSIFKKLPSKATKNGIMNSFWNTVKPFMTNKGILTDNKIVMNDVCLD